ncbi:MAG: hypothetical protein E7588_07055 [Ruminococcaceae bacterium]|nr:hypothetical protein [Oscillospiraceae bacterium]
MERAVRKNSYPAVRFLSVFLCVFMLFSFVSVGTTPVRANTVPLLYTNDSVFSYWQKTPPQTADGVVYIPISMFIDLDNVYYYSNPKSGSFYLQNEITEEYLSFSLKTSDAYNGKAMIKINIKVFNDTLYLPAIETANYLGLYIEMNTDNTIVRLSDASAKLPFGKLIEMHTPPPPVVTPPVVTPPEDNNTNVITPPAPSTDDPPVIKPPVNTEPDEPEILPCDVYLFIADPDPTVIPSLFVALKKANLNAAFALSSEYIKNNPQSVLKIFVSQYPIALNADKDYTDVELLTRDINTSNLLLERITKQKTRIITLPSDIGSGIHEILEKSGYVTYKTNIKPTQKYSSSKALANHVISKFNSFPKANVLINADMTGVSAIYELGKHINSYDIINSLIPDETVR